MRLGDLLIGQGLVTQAQLEMALERQKRDGGRLGTHLVAMGVLTIDQLLTALRGQQHASAVIEHCQLVWQRHVAMRGADEPNTYRAEYNLSRALLAGGQPREAIKHAEWALAGFMTLLGNNHNWTMEAAQLAANVRYALARVGQDEVGAEASLIDEAIA